MTDGPTESIAAKLAELEAGHNAYEHYRPLRNAADCFVSMVRIDTEDCVIWPGGKSSSGYGTLNVDGKAKNVHVLACVLGHGPRPAKAQAAHSCGVKMCFNPKHLRWATRSENEADKVDHGTSNRGDQRHHKLDIDDVLRIRRLHANGASRKFLATQYQVSRQHIGDIVNGKRWSWT